MFSWLSDLLERFADLIPLPVIVRKDQVMLEAVMGSHVREFSGRFLIMWELIASYEFINLGRHNGEVDQDLFIETGDQIRALKITTSFGWEPIDCIKMALKCENYEVTAASMVQIANARLNRETGLLPTDESVMAEADELLDKYGMRLTDLSITGQSPTRSIHHSGGIEIVGLQ